MKHGAAFRVVVSGLLCSLLLSAAGCAPSPPILIGFAGELTGKNSYLAVSARNGAELAVDAVNEAGGINGRTLRLVVKDDEGIPERARQVDAELVAQGVAAILGHPTSGQTAAVLEQINRERVVLLSPTASSSDFSNQADYFFRVVPDTKLQGELLGRYIYQSGIRTLVGVYELDNRSYTRVILRAAQENFVQMGGQVRWIYPYTTGQSDLKEIAETLHRADADGVLLVSPAIDAALLAQYLRLAGSRARFFAASWAQTGEVIANGGQAVEGMELSAVYNAESDYAGFVEFIDRYQQRYREKPDFGAAYGYEAVLVLAEALHRTGGRAEGLPEALRTIQAFPGIQGEITITETGDCLRSIYLVRIQDGRFKTIATILPDIPPAP